MRSTFNPPEAVRREAPAQVASSNLVGHTTKETSFVYQDKRGFSCFPGLKQARIPKTVVGAVVRTVPATVFAFSGSEMQATFWVSLLSKEFGKTMSGRI